jgi:hypothetical protein
MGESVTSLMTKDTGDGGGVSLDISSKSRDSEEGELSLSMAPKSKGAKNDDVDWTESGDVLDFGVETRG